MVDDDAESGWSAQPAPVDEAGLAAAGSGATEVGVAEAADAVAVAAPLTGRYR